MYPPRENHRHYDFEKCRISALLLLPPSCDVGLATSRSSVVARLDLRHFSASKARLQWSAEPGIMCQRGARGWSGVLCGHGEPVLICKEEDQAARPISTARLNVLPRLHLPPIHAVVSCGPSGTLRYGRSHLGGGFPLRCFQRLSLPDVATLRCPWRDNRYTSGQSTPVLSY